MKKDYDSSVYHPLPVYIVEPHFSYDTMSEQPIVFDDSDISDIVDSCPDWD